MGEMKLEKAREKQPRRSTDQPSAWKLGGLTTGALGKRLWTAMDAEHDDTFGRAAELAYFFFLAVFPGLLFLVTLTGIIAGNNPGMRNALFQYTAQAIPPEAWTMVQKTLSETAQAAGGWKLAIGILGALWSASSG